MRQAPRFSSLDSRLYLARIRPLVLGLFVASTILTSCGGGDSSSARGGGGLTVAISNPASIMYTRGTVTVQVTVSGGMPDRVELLKDSALLVPLSPPYRYNWDTASTPEGSYQLVARATQGRWSFSSEPRTVVVDRTPPAVASRVPGANATNVFVDDPIVVGFTKPLLPASVGPDSFELRYGGTPVPTTPLLSGDGKTVMLLRRTRLALPATLTLTVSSSITDSAGNALVGVETWSWSVPDWVAVGGAVNAVVGRDVYRSTSLALDGTGKPVVAFSEPDGDHYNVYVQRWTGSAWQSVGGSLNADSHHNANGPVLALDGNGRPVVAFSESDGTHNNVYVQQWTGSAWQSVGAALNADSRRNADWPLLVLDGSGKPVVAFSESDDTGQNNVYVLRWTGSAWQSGAAALHGDSGQLFGPVLTLDGNGRPVVAFNELDGGTHYNVYVRHWTGNAWQSVGSAVNADSGQNAFQPALAMDGSGKPLVAFIEYDVTHWNVYVRQWSGSVWQSVGGAINGVPGRDAHLPRLALDGNGRSVVAFHEYDRTHSDVYVLRWTGSDWQSVGGAVNAVAGQYVHADLALALDGSDKPVVGFSESDGIHDNVYVRHSNQ